MTGRDDGAHLLAELERENTFVERVEDGDWFRYHSLFLAFLRAEGRIRAPKLVAAAQAPAARWLAEHGSSSRRPRGRSRRPTPT